MSDTRVKVRVSTRERPTKLSFEEERRVQAGATSQSVAVLTPIVKTTAQFMTEKNVVSEKGQWYVFSDYYTDSDGVQHPGVKIGDGKAYIVDLPFVTGSDTAMLMDHINDTTRHITQEERDKWNEENEGIHFKVEGENLIMTRGEEDNG